jgi:hypothetical protein
MFCDEIWYHNDTNNLIIMLSSCEKKPGKLFMLNNCSYSADDSPVYSLNLQNVSLWNSLTHLSWRNNTDLDSEFFSLQVSATPRMLHEDFSNRQDLASRNPAFPARFPIRCGDILIIRTSVMGEWLASLREMCHYRTWSASHAYVTTADWKLSWLSRYRVDHEMERKTAKIPATLIGLPSLSLFSASCCVL